MKIQYKDLNCKVKTKDEFLKGQIVVLTCEHFDGSTEMEIPVLVTKVHKKDINHCFSYDFVFVVKGDCEFYSTIKNKKRYLWRMVSKTLEPTRKSVLLLKELFSTKSFLLNNEISVKYKNMFYLTNNNITYLKDAN